MKRVSVALAFTRFSDCHKLYRISEVLCEIKQDFELNPFNIVATISGNGSNFVKAFNEYGMKSSDFPFVEDEEGLKAVAINWSIVMMRNYIF